MACQEVMNRRSDRDDVWKAICPSCKVIVIHWVENKKYPDGMHYSIKGAIQGKNLICSSCGRKCKVAPSTWMEIDEYDEEQKTKVLKKKVAKARIRKDAAYYLGEGKP